jgi:hypothetical protein
MRCVDRRGRVDDYRGASDRAVQAPRAPIAYSQTDKNAVGNALRQVRFSRRAPEDACPKQIGRGQPSESRVDWLFSYRGMRYAAIQGWGSILRDEHRGRRYYPDGQVLAYVGELGPAPTMFARSSSTRMTARTSRDDGDRVVWTVVVSVVQPFGRPFEGSARAAYWRVNMT